MIICVTPNAAIDLTIQLSELHVNAVQRAQESIAVAGGKGVNVARVVQLLGGTAMNCAFLGGAAGRYFVELATHENLSGRWTWVDGETRICVMLAQPQHGDATVVNGQGMVVDAAAWMRMRDDVLAAAQDPTASSVCFCGSLPPGSPVDAFADVVRASIASGRRTWVDTSGAALRAVLGVAGASVKVNRAEFSDALGVPLQHLADIGRVARRLIDTNGLSVVAVTLGSEGAVLATVSGAWAAAAPQVPLVSSVGSGDAMLAGVAYGFERSLSPAEALRCGVAAGSANVMSLGGGRFDVADFQRILEETHVIELA
ncbi:MAG: 1-phosphofructokinase family hexose kinase [Chloroflexi bacterium]|nr:1-phosphofructokinase family hexose kinase [Chloroflexota bacterium]